MNDFEDLDVFLRAFTRKDSLRCISVFKLFDPVDFATQLADFIRKGLYSYDDDCAKRIKSLGLNASVDLLEACISPGSKEISILKAVARRCIDAPKEVEVEYHQEEREKAEAKALEKGALKVQPGSEATLNDCLDMFRR